MAANTQWTRIIYIVHQARPAFQPGWKGNNERFIVADRQPPWQKGFVRQLSISSARREPNGAELKWNAARALHSGWLREQRWRGPNPTPLRVCLIIYCLSPLTSINRSSLCSCSPGIWLLLTFNMKPARLLVIILGFPCAPVLQENHLEYTLFF